MKSALLTVPNSIGSFWQDMCDRDMFDRDMCDKDISKYPFNFIKCYDCRARTYGTAIWANVIVAVKV